MSDHVNRNQQDESLPRLDETSDVEVVREILLTEYKCLRDEVCKKMDHRVSLIVSSVTTSVVALGVGVERGSGKREWSNSTLNAHHRRNFRVVHHIP